MMCVEADRDVVFSKAIPLVSGTEPKLVVPSRKVIVPVGTLELCDVTVAVKVTDCPNVEGFREETNVVVVLTVLVFMSTPTEPSTGEQVGLSPQPFATITSGLPSPFRSPTAMEWAK